MNVTIESFFCPYCDEVTEAYFLLVNTILFADGEDSLRQGLERLKTQVPLDDYFVYGFGAHHLWGTPTQAQRSNPIFQVQADESRVLTPKRLRQ